MSQILSEECKWFLLCIWFILGTLVSCRNCSAMDLSVCLFVFIVMATKFVYLFICCLLLASMAESSRQSQCLDACAKGKAVFGAFCKTISEKDIENNCWYDIRTNKNLAVCRGFCYSTFRR